MSKSKLLTHCALLVALNILLTRFGGVFLPIAGINGIRLSFGDVPLILGGILYGPGAGAVVGAVTDLVGYFAFPVGGPYFPGFTLSAALTGLIPALVVGRGRGQKETFPSLGRVFLAVLLVNLVVSLFLNTFWLTLMYGKGFWLLLPPRLLARAILFPMHTGLVYLVGTRLSLLQEAAPAIREAHRHRA